MDTNKKAHELRELIYRFGKNRKIGCKEEGHIRGHDVMFLNGIAKINDDGLVKMSQLSKYFNISAPAISQITRRLEKQGYIERVIKDEDRRSVYVKISDSAKKQIDEVETKMNETLVGLIDHLGEEDTDDFIRILQVVTEYIRNSEEGDKGC